MPGYLLGFFDGAAIFEVGSDAGGSKRVAADFGGQSRSLGSTGNHQINFNPIEAAVSQSAMAVEAAE